MEYDFMVIRFSEIWLKSKSTRMKMLRRLIKNIEKATGKKARHENVRIVMTYSPNLESSLKKVFGVKTFSPVVRVELDEIETEFKKFSSEILSPEVSFRVTSSRSWKGYDRTSPEIERILGAIGAETGARVDLENPDFNLEVEIHKDYAYLFHRRIDGPGGLPIGVEGKALALFSGGIDSPVASWLAARRGLDLDFLFLNPFGPVLESRVYDVFQKLQQWIPGAELHVLDVSREIESIRESVEEGSRQTVFKRFLYRTAEKTAEELGCIALVTGESLGQVSSQTLRSLSVIGKVVDIPLVRPLVAMDKEEITRISKRIGCFQESANVPEYCSLESHSNASPKSVPIVLEEKKLSFDYGDIVSRLRKTAKEDIPDLAPPGGAGMTTVKLWEGSPNLVKGEKYLFLCRSGIGAYEEALKARKKGIEAYALEEKEARKRGII